VQSNPDIDLDHFSHQMGFFMDQSAKALLLVRLHKVNHNPPTW